MLICCYLIGRKPRYRFLELINITCEWIQNSHSQIGSLVNRSEKYIMSRMYVYPIQFCMTYHNRANRWDSAS